MKWSQTLIFAVLAGQPYVAVAAQAQCEARSKITEQKLLETIAASPNAFQGEVTAVEPNTEVESPFVDPPFPDSKHVAGTQKVIFRVLKSWKGPYHVGATVHLTVSVTSICAGFGCVSPFKTGDVTLVLAPLPRGDLPELGEGFGCWATYDGVEVKRVLWVPLPFSGD